ncbi:hypothetical protein ACF1GY_08890 [Streptomyces sp. NPDC014684]|uniref:hypothetical protein n=1 Tax=Streptomyces sp. NPDC014684 TaxID=3364880 RepID=UPI0036F7CA17
MKALEEKLVSEQNQEEVDDGQSAVQGLRTIARQISEALRAAVIEGMRVRERHLAQLVVIDRAAAQSDNIARLQERIGTEIERGGLRRIAETSDLSLFNLAGSAEQAENEIDGAYELVTPAYIDTDTGRVVERGWLRPVPKPGASVPQGKSHGRVSRENKSRNNKGSGAERHPSDDTVRLEEGTQQAVVPKASGYSENSGSAEPGSPSQRTPQPDRGPGDAKSKDRNASAREARRVASSYFVKRMLGGTAGQEKPPRRSS